MIANRPLAGSAALAAALVVLSPAFGFAQDRGVTAMTPDINEFSMTTFVSAGFAGDLENTSPEFGVAFGYGANERISLEAEVGFAPGARQGTLIQFDTNVWTLNGNVIYHFLFDEFTPYGTVGVGVA